MGLKAKAYLSLSDEWDLKHCLPNSSLQMLSVDTGYAGVNQRTSHGNIEWRTLAGGLVDQSYYCLAENFKKKRKEEETM